MAANSTSPTPLIRPPAVEVIYGLHAGSPAELELEDVLSALRECLPAGYRVEQPMHAVNVRLTTHKDNTTTESRNMQWSGVRVVHEEGAITGHFMRNGLFVNFSDYLGYDEAIGAVQQLWAAYAQAFHAPAVMQLSIRYINVLRMPFNNEGRVDLNDYFRVVLQFPDELSANMLNFHHQLTIVNDAGIQARIMLSSMKEDGEQLVVAFDNEGYLDGQWAADAMEPWEVFKELRDFTFRIFQSTLTDKCRAEIGS